MYRNGAAPPADTRPYIRILEEPATKGLRFRYECEGRSAGSIPGANSTPEKKSFPAIQICGHRGRAIVVVSCVTKDEPYRPHPHKLVGRDPPCKKGVLTYEVPADQSVVTFSNLGIQCVKKKDIEESLNERQEMRIDPFRTGYDHKKTLQSIDLNAIRLCFQVFLPDDVTGKIRTGLRAVSNVIYDKKAMSDLVITKLSHCSGPMGGGLTMILLCEKVMRDDVAVTFFERVDGAVTWEADASDVAVHKQVAIAFRTPAYPQPRGTGEVRRVNIHLRRPSDNKVGDAFEFELYPDTAGTRKQPLDLSFLSTILDRKTPHDTNNNQPVDLVSSTSPDSVSVDSGSANIADSLSNGETLVVENEKSLNELLDQVAELDEIYTENRTRLENVGRPDSEADAEDFNDAGTYTSLQLAYRNPVLIAEPEDTAYEDVQAQAVTHTFRGPIIEFSPLKRDTDDERAPPLPPKRVRKTPSVEAFKTSQTSVESLLKPGRQLPVSRVSRERTELSVARSEPALPRPKKRSFFSRLFRRRDKSPAPSLASDGGATTERRVARSVSSVSGMRPSRFKSSRASLKDSASASGAALSYADSVTHISLHGDENEMKIKSASQPSLRHSLAPLPPCDGDTILVAESVLALDATAFRKLQDDLDLTDAEHYALYMTVAPHATASEFDEASCYYSPIDGSKFHNN